MNWLLKLFWTSWAIAHTFVSLMINGQILSFRCLTLIQAKRKKTGYCVVLDLRLVNKSLIAKFTSDPILRQYEIAVIESLNGSPRFAAFDIVLPCVESISGQLLFMEKFEGRSLESLLLQADCPDDEQRLHTIHYALGEWLSRLHSGDGIQVERLSDLKAHSKFAAAEYLISTHAGGPSARRGFVHGDFSFHQIIVSNDERKIFVGDFEDFYYGEVVIDVAIYLSKLRILATVNQTFCSRFENICRHSFLAGYCAQSEVSVAERRIIQEVEQELLCRHVQSNELAPAVGQSQKGEKASIETLKRPPA